MVQRAPLHPAVVRELLSEGRVYVEMLRDGKRPTDGQHERIKAYLKILGAALDDGPPLAPPDAEIVRIPEGAEARSRFATGTRAFDKVLGGGILERSSILLLGEPGIGKTALLLQIAHMMSNAKVRNVDTGAEQSNFRVHYISTATDVEKTVRMTELSEKLARKLRETLDGGMLTMTGDVSGPNHPRISIFMNWQSAKDMGKVAAIQHCIGTDPNADLVIVDDLWDPRPHTYEAALEEITGTCHAMGAACIIIVPQPTIPAAYASGRGTAGQLERYPDVVIQMLNMGGHLRHLIATKNRYDTDTSAAANMEASMQIDEHGLHSVEV